MASHSSSLAWEIPLTEESGRLQSLGLQRIRRHRVHTQHKTTTDCSSWYCPFISALSNVCAILQGTRIFDKPNNIFFLIIFHLPKSLWGQIRVPNSYSIHRLLFLPRSLLFIKFKHMLLILLIFHFIKHFKISDNSEKSIILQHIIY